MLLLDSLEGTLSWRSLLHGKLHFRDIAIEQPDDGPFAGERTRRPLPNAARGARDDRDLAIKTPHRVPPPRWRMPITPTRALEVARREPVLGSANRSKG